MTDDLVTQIREMVMSFSIAPSLLDNLALEAADRIEADAATIARLEGDLSASASVLATEHRIRQSAVDALDAAEAKVAALVEALRDIDALDPEAGHIGACSESAIRGLVLRMGERARAAIAAAKGGAT